MQFTKVRLTCPEGFNIIYGQVMKHYLGRTLLTFKLIQRFAAGHGHGLAIELIPLVMWMEDVKSAMKLRR
jgi:hypothetical protein